MGGAAVIGALGVPVLAIDGEARVSAASPSAAALLGGDPVGRPFVTLLRHAGVNSAVEAAIAGQLPAPRCFTTTLPGQDAGRSVDVTVAALASGPDEDRIAALVTIADNSGIEQAEQMRRDFVANVSHELRTPLTTLIGFIETLRGPAREDRAARERFLEIMAAEAERMKRLVADLLSLSRVEADGRRRPTTRIDIAGLLRSVVATLSPRAAESGVEILLTGADAPLVLTADSDQMVQVFHNLISNAVKYGGSGGIVSLRVERLAHEPLLRGPAVAITVEDKGEGIEPQHLPRLTERFYRVDSHRARAQGGTGLGLAIVKHIVARHRGRLRVSSRLGEGSRFTVILPDPAEPALPVPEQATI